MKTQFEHDGEIYRLKRNWFTGMFKCTINGQTKIIEDPMNPGTHVWVNLEKQIEFSINGKTLLVIHKRPLLFSFARPHEYEFWMNGELVHKHKG